MDIQREIIERLKEKNITLQEIAQQISTQDRKISPETLSKKLASGKIRFKDAQIILDILGYKINFVKRLQDVELKGIYRNYLMS